MKQKTMSIPFWELIPYDLLMVVGVCGGAIARLCDNQVRTPRTALRQLIFSLLVGTFVTAVFCGLTWFSHLVNFGAAALITLFASLIVEICQRKLTDMRDATLADWLKAVFEAVMSEVSKYLPTKKENKP